MRKMRSNRSSPVALVAAEGAMTMAQMMEIMRSLQANVEASCIEQAKMHEDLVALRPGMKSSAELLKNCAKLFRSSEGARSLKRSRRRRRLAFFPCLSLR